MRFFMIRIALVLIGLIGTIGQNAWGQESQDSTTLDLSRAVHFLSPDGHDVLVQPGAYTVESAENALKLIPETGTAQLIGAEVSTHEEELDDPLVVSIAGQVEEFKDIHMVILLLPEGQSMEASGSYSGVRERALRKQRVTNFRKRTRSKIRAAAHRYQVSRVSKRRKPSPRLSGLYILKSSTSQWEKARKSGGKWIWPGEYDVTPGAIHLIWEIGVRKSALPKVIARDGYGFELRLNGRLLKQKQSETKGKGDFFTKEYSSRNANVGRLCSPKKTCLRTTIFRRAWRSGSAPWTVEISYWKHTLKVEAIGKPALRLPGSEEPLVKPKRPKIQKTKIAGTIYPNQTASQSYFANVVYPIFKHERCTSCHALGSKKVLVERHNGIISADIIREIPGRIGMNLGCDGGCHVYIPEPTQPVPGIDFHDSEWKTPRFDMGIDWRGKSAKYICQKVNSTLPHPKLKDEHFLHDSRIAWAVHSGLLPPPKTRHKLSLAPPGDYFKFRTLIQAWIWSGAPCPK